MTYAPATGLRLLGSKSAPLSYPVCKALVLLLTFLAYTAYHASRKPPSIVKAVLNGTHENAAASQAAGGEDYLDELGQGPAPLDALVDAVVGGRWVGSSRGMLGAALDAENGWAPFNEEGGRRLLGLLDLSFLATYAAAMFVSGHLGDRLNLRLYLAGGMALSGLFVGGFGAGYFLKIHSFYYYVVMMILGGAMQATGWPAVVAVMANWYGKGKRGLIMGIWNAHTSVGNILGTIIAAWAIPLGWGFSFLLPAACIIFMAVMILLFLSTEPAELINHQQQWYASHQEEEARESNDPLSDPLLNNGPTSNGVGGAAAAPRAPLRPHRSRDMPTGVPLEESGHARGVSLGQALAIPGVIPFALCLFCSKLVAYTFLYWLPFYISETKIEGQYLTPKQAGDLSIIFDVGGVAGGVIAGHLSDRTGASALVSTSFVLLSIPMLWIYRAIGGISFAANIFGMMLAGFFVNGPYALITTAVSADLGTHESLAGSEKALAMVTAIIDGCGSIGAAVGPLLTGFLSSGGSGFDKVFYMLYTAAVGAALMLVQRTLQDVRDMHARGAFSRAMSAVTSIFGGSPRSSVWGGSPGGMSPRGMAAGMSPRAGPGSSVGGLSPRAPGLMPPGTALPAVGTWAAGPGTGADPNWWPAQETSKAKKGSSSKRKKKKKEAPPEDPNA